MSSPEQLKAVGDSVAIPTALLAWMKAITIPDLAALAALVYTLCRLTEWVVSWLFPRIRDLWRNR